MRIYDPLTKTSFELNPDLRYVVGTRDSGTDEFERISLPIIDPNKSRARELSNLNQERGGTLDALINEMPVDRNHFELIFDSKIREWFLKPIEDTYFNGRVLSGRTQVNNADQINLGAYSSNPDETSVKKIGYQLSF